MDRSTLRWARVLAGCVLACFIVLAYGCQTGGGGGGGDDDDGNVPAGDGTVAGCAGQWTGSYAGDDAGTMTVTLAEDGGLTGTFDSTAGNAIEIVGQVDETGAATGTADFEGVIAPFTGQFDLNNCTAQGTWGQEGFGGGTWNAQRG